MANPPSVETVASPADKAFLAASALLLIGSVVGYYALQDQGLAVRLGALFGGIVLSVAAFFLSDTGKRLIAFSRDSWREVGKVVWPTRKEAIQMTLYVFGFVVVMAFFLWVTDKTLEWLLYDVVLGWRK